MKFAASLVLAALAVTAANAGKPAYLRSSDDASDREDFSPAAKGSDACPDECPDKYKPVKDDEGVEYPNKCFMRMAQCKGASSGLLDLSDFYGSGSVDEDDLTIDLTELFGDDSTDGSHVMVDIIDLIGSGSDQVDIQDIIDALEEEQGWDDSEDPNQVKRKGGAATKGKPPVYYEDDVESESGSDDLSWLFDSDSESGPLMKDKGGVATKGKPPVYQEDDSDSESDPLMKDKGGVATKGKPPVYQEDDSGSDDPLDAILFKGDNEPATKSSKSSKASTKFTTTGSIDDLFDDDSEGGIIGDESDEEDPTLVKGAPKGKTPPYEKDPTHVKGAPKGKTPPYEEDDSESESASDEEQEQQQTDVPVKGDKEPATKSSKVNLPTKKGHTTGSIDEIFDDASEGGIIGDEFD